MKKFTLDESNKPPSARVALRIQLSSQNGIEITDNVGK